VIRFRKKACERDAHFLRSEFYFSTCDDNALELPNYIITYIVCYSAGGPAQMISCNNSMIMELKTNDVATRKSIRSPGCKLRCRTKNGKERITKEK